MHHRALRALGEPALVRVALALAEARLRGAEKFSWADHLLADPQGVEVATPERLARLKAHRFAQRSCGGSRRSKRADRCRGTRGEQRDSHGGTPILLDLACGIGGDGRELSRVAAGYLGLDLDPLRCLMARHNSGAEVREWDLRQGLPEELLAGTSQVRGQEPFAGKNRDQGRNLLFHFDPLRRAGGRRLRGVEGLLPFEKLLHQLSKSTQGGALKLGPEVDREELEGLGLGEFSLEYFADAGGVVQAVAWLGTLREMGVPLRVTRLLGAGRAGEVGELRSFGGEAGVPARGPGGGRWLLLPDPLLDHARLAGARLRALGLAAGELHPGLGIFRAESPCPDPWFQSFEILAELPLREKKIKAWLRAHDGGRVQVRTRGKAVRPEAWTKKLGGQGSRDYCLFALRLGSKLCAFLTAPAPPPS